MVNYSKKIMEPYAIDVLATSYNEVYRTYKNYEENGFDFESEDRTSVLEVTVAMTDQERTLIEYERAYEKKGVADEKRVLNPFYYDSKFMGIQVTLDDLVNSIISSILKKEGKRKSRESGHIIKYELCVLSPSNHLFDVNSVKIFQQYICGFDKIFIATPSDLFIIDDKSIEWYDKKFTNTYNIGK